jgi:hypothetical protein
LYNSEWLGYGTTSTDSSVDLIVYADILQTSLLDPLKYYDMNRNGVRFQQDNITPHTTELHKTGLVPMALYLKHLGICQLRVQT